MECCSGIKNKIESLIEMWMNLETIIQSEMSERKKTNILITTYI